MYTREQLPQQWATTQNNLGNALQEQGIRTGGEAGARLRAEAVTAYRQALEVRTLETLPLQWAQTQNNLGQAYAHLEDWANAAASYTDVLQVYPDYKAAYQTAAHLYHERLFKFPEAFALNAKWLDRHPDDLSALSDFAEKNFTTSRFAECEQRIADLLANPAIEPHVNVAMRAIEIANLFALDKTELIPTRIHALREIIVNRLEDFKVNWSFEGTKYFIRHNQKLTPYRSWLLQFFSGVEAEDRNAILTALQDTRATIPALLKQ